MMEATVLIETCWFFFVPFPRSVPQYSPILWVLRQLLWLCMAWFIMVWHSLSIINWIYHRWTEMKLQCHCKGCEYSYTYYILFFLVCLFLSFIRISSKLFSHWEVCVCKTLSWKINFIHFGIILWNKWSPVNTWNNHLIYFLVHYPGLRCTVIAALMSTIYHEITAGPDVYIIQNSGNYGCLVIF